MIKFGMPLGIALFVCASILPMQSGLADIGPKPSMQFEFVPGAGVQNVSIVSGTLLECEQSDCQDAKPLQQLGPQGFHCGTNSCSALAYGFSPYHQLEVQFSDGISRKSNVFKTAGFQSSYAVTIQQTDLAVKAKITLDLFSPYTYVLACGICLIGIIILIVVIVLLVRRSRKK
jgi:hypothetical protein